MGKAVSFSYIRTANTLRILHCISEDSGLMPGAEVGKKRSMGQLSNPGATKQPRVGSQAPAKAEQAVQAPGGAAAPPLHGLLPAPPPAFAMPGGRPVPSAASHLVPASAPTLLPSAPSTLALPCGGGGVGKHERQPVLGPSPTSQVQRLGAAPATSGRRRRSESPLLTPAPANNGLPDGAVRVASRHGPRPMPGPAEGFHHGSIMSGLRAELGSSEGRWRASNEPQASRPAPPRTVANQPAAVPPYRPLGQTQQPRAAPSAAQGLSNSQLPPAASLVADAASMRLPVGASQVPDCQRVALMLQQQQRRQGQYATPTRQPALHPSQMTSHAGQQATDTALCKTSAAHPDCQVANGGGSGKPAASSTGAEGSAVNAAGTSVAAGRSQQNGAATGGRTANGHLHMASQPYRAGLANGCAVPVPLPSVKAS